MFRIRLGLGQLAAEICTAGPDDGSVEGITVGRTPVAPARAALDRPRAQRGDADAVLVQILTEFSSEYF